jgi:hypothetical protein
MSWLSTAKSVATKEPTCARGGGRGKGTVLIRRDLPGVGTRCTTSAPTTATATSLLTRQESAEAESGGDQHAAVRGRTLDEGKTAS